MTFRDAFTDEEDRQRQELVTELEAMEPRFFQAYRTLEQQQALYKEWVGR